MGDEALIHGLIRVGVLSISSDVLRRSAREAGEEIAAEELDKPSVYETSWHFPRYVQESGRTQLVRGRLTVKEALFGVSGFPGKLWFRKEHGIVYIILRGIRIEEVDILMRILNHLGLDSGIHINDVHGEAD